MANIEIGPLTDRLADDEITELKARMERMGAPKLPEGDDKEVASVGDGLDDDVLVEFLDRLDGHDVAAEIYLPVEFEGSIEVADLRVGSGPALLEVLEELKDELTSEGEDEDEDEEAEDEDEDRRIHGRELRRAWKMFNDGALAALERQLPLHIRAS
jgi:hypothetical protein